MSTKTRNVAIRALFTRLRSSIVNPRIVVGLSSGVTYTTDGGKTTVSFGSTSAIVPRRQPSTTVLAGFPDGTLQGLGSTIYTFPAALTSIFVNESNELRITVGLANGDVWRSLDGGSTWTFLYSFGARLTQLYEAADALTTYVAAANSIWITRRSFQDVPQELVTLTTSISQFVVSAFGNYVGTADGTVQNIDDGTVLVGPTSPVLGLAFNPRQATLWVLEQAGKFWRKPAGGSSLTNLSSIPGGGGRLVPVAPIPGLILSHNAAGAWLSPDAGVSWKRMLAGNATSIGCYSTPVPGSP